MRGRHADRHAEGSSLCEVPGVDNLPFQCNICGSRTSAPLPAFERDTPSCGVCGSIVRWRAVVHLLSTGLFGESLAIRDFPESTHLHGLGMSDWVGYAELLPFKLDYANTFVDRDPQLDITVFKPKLEGQLDFVISSDVFEHVPPPVDVAFENTRRMLKPGGLFVLTVPYRIDLPTQEHFPGLNEYSIEVRDGHRVLVNITKDGERQEFDNLVFHGDTASQDGSLEMRVLSEDDIVRHLAAAGFTDIHVCREPEERFGIRWEAPWSLPITARAA